MCGYGGRATRGGAVWGGGVEEGQFVAGGDGVLCWPFTPRLPSTAFTRTADDVTRLMSYVLVHRHPVYQAAKKVQPFRYFSPES